MGSERAKGGGAMTLTLVSVQPIRRRGGFRFGCTFTTPAGPVVVEVGAADLSSAVRFRTAVLRASGRWWNAPFLDWPARERGREWSALLGRLLGPAPRRAAG